MKLLTITEAQKDLRLLLRSPLLMRDLLNNKDKLSNLLQDSSFINYLYFDYSVELKKGDDLNSDIITDYLNEKIDFILEKQKNNPDNSILNCDFYHITMLQTMFLENRHEDNVVYEMFIRKNPFGGAYTIAAGLRDVLDWVEDFEIKDDEVEYLKEQGINEDFLKYLQSAKLEFDIDAVPEGEIVFPNEPIAKVKGKQWQALIIESLMLNIINSQSLIATKASRIKNSAGNDLVLEFGLRRSQVARGLESSRAAVIGGADSVSNVKAGKKYGIPVKGTHAHAYIMSYGQGDENEKRAYYAYIKNNPDNACCLVDTYDTIQGTKFAVEMAQKVQEELGRPVQFGIRLDSGDLAYLSKECRKIMDEGGFENASIVASNDLDEYTIDSLKQQGSKIDVWGVGTKLVTAYDQPAIGGVYKMKEVNNEPQIKLAEDKIKVSIPGATEVIRFYAKNKSGHLEMLRDVIIPEGLVNVNQSGLGILKEDLISVNQKNDKEIVIPTGTPFKKVLEPVVRKGQVLDTVNNNRNVMEIGENSKSNMKMLNEASKRLENPHIYVAGIEKGLYELRNEMMAAKRPVVKIDYAKDLKQLADLTNGGN